MKLPSSAHFNWDMKYEVDFEAEDQPSRAGPFIWVLRGMLTFCAVLMTLVILSDPRVMAGLKSSTQRVSTMLEGGGAVAQLKTEVAPEIPQITKLPERDARPEPPKVSIKPADRVPVRRGNFVSED